MKNETPELNHEKKTLKPKKKKKTKNNIHIKLDSNHK